MALNLPRSSHLAVLSIYHWTFSHPKLSNLYRISIPNCPSDCTQELKKTHMWKATTTFKRPKLFGAHWVWRVWVDSPEGQWAMALHFLEKSPWDVLTFNSGLNVCAKAGKWQICLHILSSMKKKDVVSYSICISSFEKSSQWQHAVGLLQDMLQSKVEPSEVSFNAAISACKSQTHIALSLFEDMELLKVQRSVVTFNAALTACDKGNWQEALHLMEKLYGHGQDGLDMDPITLSGILTACESVWAVSLHVLDSYLAKGKVPHGLHAGSVLKAMSSSRQWHSALALLQDLRSIWEMNERTNQVTQTSQTKVSKATANSMLPDFKSWHEFWPSGQRSISSISSKGGSTETNSTNTLCDAPIPIIYREDDFMAVSKPAGVSTGQTLQLLADQFSTCIFSMSRLDLPTSGILPMVVGQEATISARWFLSQFAGTLVSKEYICLCNGRFEPLSGQIDLPLRIEARQVLLQSSQKQKLPVQGCFRNGKDT